MPVRTSVDKAIGFLERYATCVARSLALYLGGVLTPDGRTRLNRIHAILAPARYPLGDVAAGELAPTTEPVRLPLLEGAFGNVNPYEYVTLALIAKARRPLKLFEIGTFDGRSTHVLAANAPDTAELFTLDLPADQAGGTRFPLGATDLTMVRKPASGERFGGTAYAPRIRQLFGDSGRFDFSPWRGAMDLVFVDGSHEYDYVRQDSLSALALAAPGAIILWHDFGGSWIGVTEALLDLHRTNPAFAGLRRIRETSFAFLTLPDRPDRTNPGRDPAA